MRGDTASRGDPEQCTVENVAHTVVAGLYIENFYRLKTIKLGIAARHPFRCTVLVLEKLDRKIEDVENARNTIGLALRQAILVRDLSKDCRARQA
ncbi:hypothetical protein BURMUCF1_A1563 [Burkholderia multivorans ATCC BAA-247]|nr:hypothetical protein BURMUCF1_A1563 [Burkholderia multivorans ATCC BAA-247]